ncbi:unnamed protein product [Prunus brigantina]
MGIALCVVFEVQANLSEFHHFEIRCSPQRMQTHGFSKTYKVSNVSDNLWVIYLSREQFETKCGPRKVLLTPNCYCFDPIRWMFKKSGACVTTQIGFRLVHEQDVEQLNQIMMNKSIIKSTTTCPTKSADAQGQQCHDDEEASPGGSGSSHQNISLLQSYVLSEESTEIWGLDAIAGIGHTANVQLELIESSHLLIGQDGISQQEFSIRRANICIESI